MVGTGMQINNDITLLNTKGFLRKALSCEKMLYLFQSPIKIVNIYNVEEENLLPGDLLYVSMLFHQWIYWHSSMRAIKSLGKQDWDGENLSFPFEVRLMTGISVMLTKIYPNYRSNQFANHKLKKFLGPSTKIT